MLSPKSSKIFLPLTTIKWLFPGIKFARSTCLTKTSKEKLINCTIIYTSGTTGQPKGVMHTFGSFSYAARNILEMINLKGEQHFFSYLPLAHVAERALIEVGSLYINASISFLENKTTFPENLRKTQPTIFLAVPHRESIQTKILQKLAKRNFLLLKLPYRSIHQKKAQKEIGFSRVQFAITGAACKDLSSGTMLRYFNIECYGMTENLTYSHGNLETPLSLEPLELILASRFSYFR